MENRLEKYGVISICIVAICLTSWYIITSMMEGNVSQVLRDRQKSNPLVANTNPGDSVPEFTVRPTIQSDSSIPTFSNIFDTPYATQKPLISSQPSSSRATTSTPNPTVHSSTPPKTTPTKTAASTLRPTNTPVVTVARTPVPTATMPPQRYRDGTYSATGRYQTRTGEELIGVKVTVQNDIVTYVEVTPMADNSRSLSDQKKLAEEVPKYVVGQSLDFATHIENIVGSSDTTDGFKNAIEQIIVQASN